MSTTTQLDLPRPRESVRDGQPPSPTALPSVLLVSADPLMRMSWSARLRNMGMAALVSEALSVSGAHALIGQGPAPALIVLSAEFLTSDAGVAKLGLSGPIVVVGDPDSIDAVRAAMQIGVRGYLFGSAPAVADGDAEISGPGASENRSITVLDAGGVARELTRREVQILQHAADGESNIEIGHALDLSPFTVKSHLARIGRKVRTGDRAHMVLLALRAGAVR